MKTEIKQAYHLIIGEGSHIKLWARVVLFPFVLFTFTLACLVILMEHTIEG